MRLLRSVGTIANLGRHIATNQSAAQWKTPIKMNIVSSSFLLTRGFVSDDGIKKTALYSAHIQMKGKMIDWAGYSLPMQYDEGIYESHLHVRQYSGLFDLSHFGQFLIQGEDRISFLESLIVGDLQALSNNQICVSLLTNEHAGIIGECIIINKENHLYMVSSAECKDAILKHMQVHLELWNQKNKSNVKIESVEDRSLISLQGPKSAEVLDALVQYDLSTLGHKHSIDTQIKKIDCWICRCGYSGEDGFEISIDNENVFDILNLILSNEFVRPQGLVVRDSLRLEAGLCTYPGDMNHNITLNEAGLLSNISKRRLKEGGFPGHATIIKQFKEKVRRKRIGLIVEKGNPARVGSDILSPEGNKIGSITSSTVSPSLKKKIAMGYVAREYSMVDTQIAVGHGGKNTVSTSSPAKVVKMPFVPTNYYYRVPI